MASHFVLTLFHQLFSIFIHSTGDGRILARVHGLIQKEPTQSNNLLLLVPIALSVILDILIRYIIGHVLMSILIIETVEKQTNASEHGDKKPAPSSRQLLQTITAIYRKGGLRLLLNGIGSACTYWAMHSSVAKASSIVLPSPVAYIIASVLLAEKHFFWTARTILPRDQLHLVPERDRQRWKVLAIPTLFYAVAEMMMMHVPALFDTEQEIAITGLSYIVGSDILIAGFMLFAQLFLLFPSYILLILVQASLLPPTCEMLVFTQREQQWGRRVGEIFAVNGGPLRAQEAVQMVGVARLLWCLELHGKMCLCLFGVAAVVHSAVYSMK
ncbi:hypothetical protein HAV15_001826 [Penicillium sp. str. |nr:hypothetical protein HAV15_001826 [Penicillium sp. str. \